MEYISIGEAAKLYNVSISSLRNWEKAGKIKSYRTDGNHRRFDKAELDSLFNKNKVILKNKITVGYARVSTLSQKEDLERQVKVITNYCEIHGYNFKIIKDFGSGLNYNKKGLNELIELISLEKIDKIVINYKDRLLRFGFELIEQLCKIHNVQIEIINQSDFISDEEELVEDVLSVITVYSSKLYGKRSHKNKQIITTNQKLFKEG